MAESKTPELYAWDVGPYGADPCLCAGGVTDDEAAAFDSVRQVLDRAPSGTEGTVWHVGISPYSPDYEYFAAIGHARRGENGTVVWTGHDHS